MKILMCNSFFYLRGGSERCFFDLTNLLVAHGHEVIPFSMHHEKNQPSPYADYFVSHIDYPSLLNKNSSIGEKINVARRVIYSSEAKKNIERLIADTKPDIAHIHGIAAEISPSILPAIKNAGIPVVQTLHDFRLICPATSFYSQGEVCERCKGHRYYNVVLRRCKRDSFSGSLLAGLEMSIHKLLQIYERNVDRFITPSAFLKDKLVEFGIKNEVIHLPNFVDIQGFIPDYDSENHFVYYGRLEVAKGVLTLLKAMKLIPDGKLYIAGRGHAEEEMRQFITQNSLENVFLVGHLGLDELIPLVQKAAFTIVPSELYDNYPMAVVESLALGTPVIGSRIGGIPEQVGEDRNGLLFTPGDHEELAQKIRFMLDNPDKAKMMGRSGRKQVEMVNSPEHHYRETIAIYNELVSPKNELLLNTNLAPRDVSID